MYRNLTATTTLVGLTLISSASISSMSAQPNDRTVIDRIATELRLLCKKPQSPYRIVVKGSTVIIIDPSNAQEIASIRDISSNRVVIRSLLAVSTEDSDRLHCIINEYNDHAAVGTMERDYTNGYLILIHNLNPQQVNSPSIARTALLVAEAARLAKQRCMQATTATIH